MSSILILHDAEKGGCQNPCAHVSFHPLAAFRFKMQFFLSLLPHVICLSRFSPVSESMDSIFVLNDKDVRNILEKHVISRLLSRFSCAKFYTSCNLAKKTCRAAFCQQDLTHTKRCSAFVVLFACFNLGNAKPNAVSSGRNWHKH